MADNTDEIASLEGQYAAITEQIEHLIADRDELGLGLMRARNAYASACAAAVKAQMRPRSVTSRMVDARAENLTELEVP